MKLTNALVKLDKIGGSHRDMGNGMYGTTYKGYEISFICNTSMDAIDCIYLRKLGHEDEPITDYLAGSFRDTLTAAVATIDRISSQATQV